MKLLISKFGKMLMSRPAGKEALAAAKAYVLPKTAEKEIVLDFSGVDVLSPSWADEFISGIRNLYPGVIVSFVNTKNPSVEETLNILSK
ncbi:STAS-like domain-containing protein [Candidatus Saganbacteria bacterium]|nr:STAS-like domain-containing protein [Candidatus Saganbacteria bacterium]